MGTKIRLTALILAASLTMNMVIMPVKAEDIAAPIEQLESEPVESIAAQTESSEPTSPTTESSEPTSPTTEPSEPTSPETESSEPISPTTESSEPGAGEESSDLPEQLLTPEEEETLLEETGESMLFSTLTRAEPVVSDQLKALAEEDASSSVDSSTIQITSGYELYYLAKNVDAAIYQNSTLKFTNSQDGFDVSGYDFPGLGKKGYPFGGQITFEQSSLSEFILITPLFQYLYDSAQVEELILHYAGTGNSQTALFAANVVEGNGGGGNWSFTLQGDLSEADVTCTPPLIGTIEEGSNVSLQVKDLINLSVETAGNAGLLCGTLNGSLTLTSLSKREPISVKATDAAGGLVGEMGSGAELTVQVPELNVESVSAANGNAGGLVGKMCGGATLTVAPVTVTDSESGSPATSPAALSVNNVTATSTGNAGGLVGEMDNGAVLNVNASLSFGGTISATADSAGGLVGKAQDVVFTNVPVPGSGTVTGVNAGGLIGSYTYSGVSGVLSTVSQNISGITVNGSSNAGGVFGVLNNTSESGTFAISANTVSTTLETSADVGNAGGLIGQYSAANLDAALVLSPTQVTANLTSSASAFGGLIGWVSGGPAYLELSGAVALKGTAKNYGGLIGSLSDSGLIGSLTDSGHMVVVNDATITKKDDGTIKGTEKAGGLIGWQPHGVLKLAGKSTVTTPECDKKECLGNILGYRDNTLVYSTSQWTPMDGGKNDIGNWGQVLCASQLSGLLDESWISTSHTVTVIAPASASIGTVVDFAKVAMQFQLSSKDALIVEESTADLTQITLTKDINLSGTGLTGFQRDYSSATVAENVILDGGGRTITLPGIKTYTYSGAHDYQGLFSKVTNLKAEDLIISGGSTCTVGEDNIANVGIQLECNGNFYVGGLAANASGNITLTSVTAGASIITNDGSNASIGGLVGRRIFENTNKGTLTCSSCSWTSTIRVSGNSSGIYVGGLVGRVDNEGKSGVGMDMSFTNCTISGTLSRTGKPDDARIGGMLGACYGRLKNNDTDPLCFNLLIDGVKVNGATVTSDAKNEMGGLLSLEWLDTNVTVKNVVVKNSTVSSTYTSSFGGLVFKAMGYCKIESTTTTEENGNTTTIPGVTIESGIFSGPSPAGAPSALLICHGEERGDLKNALYLEILDGAYQIESSGITLDLKGSTTFDEIIGTTFGSEGKGNGIVSIATPGDLIYKETDGVKSRNTYGNQLGTNYTNSRTRYYYNLDSFGAVYNPPSGDINSPEKMVMFSAYSHADDSIKGYFYLNPGNITNPTGDIIDLTGYSYYPAEQFVDISGATIKFAFKDINDKEEGNKPLDDSNRQHYGMHTGIFRNVVNSGDSDATLRVTNLTLQGSVGHVGGRSGALICGDVHGNSTKSKKMILEIHDVTLDGIAVSPAPQKGTVAPLLINSLGSYTTLNMSGVVTAGYAADVTAASSLIGPVGSDTGAAINLTFSDMALDGKNQTDGKTYNGTDSIFSRALFLESFRYSESNCSGVYNFGVDATRYTVGQELSNTGGGDVDGRNNGAQYWFHNSDMLVCSPATDKETHYQGYRRYVHWVEGKDGNNAADVKSHEIDVNVRTFGLTEGCGTYSHPYIIKDGNQLKELAEVLNSGGKKEGWKVNLSAAVIDKSFSNQNGHTASSSEEDIDCVTYTGGKDEWSGTKGGTTYKAANDVVLQYLRNAYYVIRGPEDSETKEITLSGTWAGLGGSETTKAFSGVIVGENDVTVKIVRSDLGQQFGGLIKFSQGSVVKNLKIAYTETPTVTANGVPTTSDASFFGGVVGWCIGGDTIIDNVTVTYQNGEPAVSGNNGHLTAVGGYVGMVGGAINDAGDNTREKYGGGVVFRGDISGRLGGKSDNYFYYNPYVGRVLDGYVLSEKTKLDNTDDNYQIPQISEGKTLTRATVDGKDTVTVTDADDLWLLSAIANSGAGAMGDANCLAYNVGKPRTGTYANVGGSMSDDDKTDEGLLGGVAGNRTTCYLSKYVSGDFSTLCSSGVSIVLESDCDMSTFGNGFRGIGASYATNANGDSNYRLIQVSSVNGNNHTVTLGQSRKEYTEEKDNWTSIGSGLFVLLRIGGDSLVASNLNLSGKTGITYYEGTSIATAQTTGLSDAGKRDNNKRLSLVGVGMLVGNLASVDNNSQITLDSVHLLGTKDEKVTVNVDDDGSMGTTFAGGLAGYLWINRKSITKLTLRDCTYEYLSVRGRIEAGGFIGYTTAQEVSIEYTSAAELKDGTVKTTLNKCNQYDGVGGLIGEVNNGKLDINAAGISSLTVRDLSVSASVNGTENNVGGLIGVLRAADAKACVLKNIHMEGEIELAGSLTTSSNVKSNVGLIAGGILDKDGSWNNAGTASYNFEVSNFRVAQENGSNVKLYRGWQVGGLIGLYRTGNKNGYGTLKLDDIRFGSESNTISILNGTNIDGSHNCAASCLVATSCLVPQVEVTDVQIVNTKILSRKYGAFLYARIDNQSDATQTIDFKNISIENSTVAVSNGPSNNTNDSAESYYGIGALYGRIDNKGATITGCNILFRDCQIGFHVANDGSRKLAGITNDMPQTLNVGLSNSTATQKNTSYLCYDDISENERSNYTRGNIAIFGGSLANDTNKSVKLVGVSIQQQENTLPMKDFGTNPGSYYVVRADYTGNQDGNITGAKAPYVTTSPLSPLNTPDKTITGDGASFVKDTTTPVGDQILADLKTTTDSAGAKIQPTNLNLKHSTALAYGESASDANAKKAYTYLLENSGKAFFGDFKQQGGNSEEDYTGGSFPVLTLVTNSSVEANKLIYSWISLLTNRTINDTVVSASGSDVSIAVTRWKWSASGWTTDDTEKLPLKFESNTFSLNKGIYDSGQNRFTLLDVAFDDPADNTKDAYHLYIPVIVQKMLRFRFWASAQTGTTYIKNPYMTQEALAAASHGQQVTVLMGFEYKRTQAEWKEAVNNGDNLLFGFEKTIQLDGNSLPRNTRLTLVDCANQNKVYYATGSEIEGVQGNTTKHNLSFTEFDGWSPVNLCDMLELSVGTSPGQYYQLENVTTEEAAKAADATLRVWNGTGYVYYKYYAEEDTNRPEGTGVSITVGWNPKTVDDFLREQYYLTIQTPAGETEIRNNQIICPSSLRSSKLPTLREKNDRGGDYTRNGYENRVLIGDFFDQNVTISTEAYNNPEMSTVNHVIQATLTSEIKFSSLQSAEMFKTYAKGQNLFQSFDLRMRKTEKAGEQPQRINLVPGTRITAKYFLGDTPVGTKTYTIARSTPSFRLDFPKGVDVGTWDENNGAKFEAKLTLEYPDAAILAQFPLVAESTEGIGVNLGTSSYLAYTQEALPTTTIHDDAGWDAKNFYRRDFKAASLNYYPVKRTVNSTVESVNQLGVNGWNQQNGLIYSAATYDASALDGAGNAKTLRCTLNLKRKTADGGYEAVDGWTKYLVEGSAPTVSVYYNTLGRPAAESKAQMGEYEYVSEYTLTSFEKDVPIEIRVDINVLTGAGFEAEGKALIYANYKVEMCVELLDSTGRNVIAGSRAEDYIVYTNARINPNPIR